MRCPDCNKFVSGELEDPHVDDVDVADGQVLLTTSITLVCADCGTPLKEAEFQQTAELPPAVVAAHAGHALSVAVSDAEPTEEKGPRGATLYGFVASVAVTCACGVSIAPVQFAEEIKVAAMDDLV